MELAIVVDFVDETAYRRYDEETEHNRLRSELGPYTKRIARVQFEFPG